MSRGGRGGRGGGRGGRGMFGALPMGLSFADMQSLSREGTALYPPMDPLPALAEFTKEEVEICRLQTGFAERLKRSAYYIVEHEKPTELPKYSDKYRPSPAARPTLKRKDFHAPFFPPDIFEDYFNPKRRKKVTKKGVTKKVNIDDMDDGEDAESTSTPRSSQPPSDYDVDEEYDNDYAENYFDNGEADDMDDLGGGAGGDDGGGYDYD